MADVQYVGLTYSGNCLTGSSCYSQPESFTVVEAVSVGDTSVNRVVAFATPTGSDHSKTKPPSLILPLIQVEHSQTSSVLSSECGAILPPMTVTVSARQVPLAWLKRPAMRK